MIGGNLVWPCWKRLSGLPGLEQLLRTNGSEDSEVLECPEVGSPIFT